MIPLDEVIALLRRLGTLGWTVQIAGLAFLLAGYALLLFIAWRNGGRNIADLKDENAALEEQVAESDAKRRSLRDEDRKLESAIGSLQARRPEERLTQAAMEREHGNEKLAIRLYQEIFATFGPDLAHCCEALATGGGDEPEVERYRTLALRLAGLGAQR
jgi:regulator of replication initiation timing